ncbi:MAG: hypothetical protein J1F07_04370 [Muribaculaceae bacterium]|nr:hypothetical protein [Muribaculaceae bacterium]
MKPKLEKTKIIKNPNISRPRNQASRNLEAVLNALGPGWGMREAGSVPGTTEPQTNEDFVIGAMFKIKHKGSDPKYPFQYFVTQGTSSVLSLFKMVQGIYHIEAFETNGAEKSEDYDTLQERNILKLPQDYTIASQFVQDNLIGKTLRIVARSGQNTDTYRGRYYIFAIED